MSQQDEDLALDCDLWAFVGRVSATIEKAREKMTDEELEIADAGAAQILNKNSWPKG